MRSIQHRLWGCGNCHKWFLGPRGSGFLYTRRELQHLVKPLVVSWGWGDNAPYASGSRYIDNLEWWGTNDPSAYLAVPAAIRFQEKHDWAVVRRRCNHLLQAAIRRICTFTGLENPYSEAAEPFAQMAIAPLPRLSDPYECQTQFYRRYRIEIPFTRWKERQFLRISVQGYNTPADIEALVAALEDFLPQILA